MHVIDTVDPERDPATATADARLVWIGEDDRGVEREIVVSTSPTQSSSSTSCQRSSGGQDVTERERYRWGPDVPDDEELRDSQGRLVDDAYVEAAVERAMGTVRRRGRPSLSDEGESPLLRVRLSRELDDAIRRAVKQARASRSEWVRRVLDEAVHRAS